MKYNFPSSMINVYVCADFKSASEIKPGCDGFHFVVLHQTVCDFDVDALLNELLARINGEHGIILTSTQRLYSLHVSDRGRLGGFTLAQREHLLDIGLNAIFYSPSYDAHLVHANGLFINGRWTPIVIFDKGLCIANPALARWRVED